MTKSSERSHNQAKHKRRWADQRALSADEDDDYGRWRQDYFRNVRPDLDPQSQTSKVLEFLGLDPKPYSQNADGYDYRKKQWDKSVASGNPDMSWSIPELDGIIGAFGGSEVDGVLPSQAETSAAIEGELGRAPTPEELANMQEALRDPRSRDEKNAGMALGMLDFPLLGFGDEAMAGAMSIIPGRGSYDDELELARQLQGRWNEHEEPFSARSIGSIIPSFAAAGPAIAALDKGAAGATRVVRKAFGNAPQAASRVGRAIEGAAIPAASGAALFGAMDVGEGKGDIGKRLANVKAGNVLTGAAFGGTLGAVSGAGRAVTGGAKKIRDKVRERYRRDVETAPTNRARDDAPVKPEPRPDPKKRAMPQEPTSVRDDIELAFRTRRKK